MIDLVRLLGFKARVPLARGCTILKAHGQDIYVHCEPGEVRVRMGHDFLRRVTQGPWEGAKAFGCRVTTAIKSALKYGNADADSKASTERLVRQWHSDALDDANE